MTLVPIMESIGAQISPLRDPNYQTGGNIFLTDLTPVAARNRFKTPSARTIDPDDLGSGVNLKYLHSGKMDKESIKDYI